MPVGRLHTIHTIVHQVCRNLQRTGIPRQREEHGNFPSRPSGTRRAQKDVVDPQPRSKMKLGRLHNERNSAAMTMAVTVFFIFVTPIDTLAVAVAPEFYSNLISPLAQTAALYSGEYGLAIPSTLPMDKCTIDSSSSSSRTDMTTDNTAAAATATVATFAGGCFWGLELAYQREPGVLATCVGYTQGDDDDDSSAAAATYPTYAQVCSETTGHTEAVLVVFDPVQVNYAKLANVLFDRIPDPTMLHRVGKDRGTQYRTGMYAHSQEQLVDAQTAFDRENRSWMVSGRAVVTEVAMARTFWPAEEQHQRYLEKGGRFGRSQSAEKGIVEEIKCYG